MLQQKASRLEDEIQRRIRIERELSEFLENALEGIHTVSPDGVILWANKAELDLLGYKADEYIGHKLSDFHVDKEECETVLRRLISGENLYNYPVKLRAKDGSVKYVLIHSNACFEDGKFLYTRCFTRDMSEILAADRDRATLAAIIENSQGAIISKSFDGIIRSWNKAAENLFEYSAEEAIGKEITIIIPEDRLAEERSLIERLKRGETIAPFETVRRTKSGRLVDISLTISPIKNSKGELIGASKFAQDITEKKLAAARLQESEERFKRLVELLPVAVYTCDADGKITFVNSQAIKLWGREPELGTETDRFCGSYKIFLPKGEIVPREDCPMARALEHGTSYRNVEADVERPDGSRITALVNIDPIKDENGNLRGAINVFHDISAIKEAELKLRAEDRRKDEFLATLAHELRNPLAPIRNGLQLLKISGQSSGSVGHIHSMIERQVNHMVRLVDDLLEVSRISRGKIELKRDKVSLTDAIHHAVETTKPFIDSNKHSLSLSLPDTPVIVEGDHVRLSQVFANLLNNACKYTNEGGTIDLSLELTRDKALVHVKDSGIGIPAEMLSRVFEIFAQVDNPLRKRQEGLGIGLNLVQSLVNLHGGTVEAKSQGIGHGSEFLVSLPLAESIRSVNKLSGQDESEKPASRTMQRILCVDDNRDSADSMAMMLSYLGADVKVAYDGPSALEALKFSKPSVVLMDLGMPGMDGMEVAKAIRSDPELKDIILIALTGWGTEEDRRKTKQAGFDHHFVKPVDFTALQELLARLEKKS